MLEHDDFVPLSFATGTKRIDKRASSSSLSEARDGDSGVEGGPCDADGDRSKAAEFESKLELY